MTGPKVPETQQERVDTMLFFYENNFIDALKEEMNSEEFKKALANRKTCPCCVFAVAFDIAAKSVGGEIQDYWEWKGVPLPKHKRGRKGKR